MVIFGDASDASDAAHKVAFLALYRLERRRLLGCPIIGVAHDLSVEQLRKYGTTTQSATLRGRSTRPA